MCYEDMCALEGFHTQTLIACDICGAPVCTGHEATHLAREHSVEAWAEALAPRAPG